MTSELRVSTIAAVGGTSAMTLNSNGTMTPSQMVYASFVISAQYTATSSNAIISNWQATPSPATTLGASMTNTSGVFTFPHTGKFMIKLQMGGYASGGNRGYVGGSIKYSSNSGGSYSIISRSLQNCHADGVWFTSRCDILIEITNISTQSIAFHNYVNGNTVMYPNDNGTMCVFQQVG